MIGERREDVTPDKPALAPKKGNHWDNFSIWTGSIIRANDQYYMFYTGRRIEDKGITTPHERRRPQNVGVAVSEDLLN